MTAIAIVSLVLAESVVIHLHLEGPRLLPEQTRLSAGASLSAQILVERVRASPYFKQRYAIGAISASCRRREQSTERSDNATLCPSFGLAIGDVVSGLDTKALRPSSPSACACV